MNAMEATRIIGLGVLGLFAGSLSGLLGIGGAVVIIPALVMIFGYTQETAQGTTLALMVLPIGFLAALQYYKAGSVDIKAGAIIALFFFVGGFFGAKLAVAIPTDLLKKGFAVLLMVVAVRMFFK